MHIETNAMELAFFFGGESFFGSLASKETGGNSVCGQGPELCEVRQLQSRLLLSGSGA